MKSKLLKTLAPLKKYYYVLIAILIVELNFSLLGNFESDFGWHYFLGNFMLQTKHLVNNMVGYNLMPDIHLADHEWLTEIILAFLMNKFGYISLIICSFAITVVIFYLIYKIASRFSTSQYSYFVLLLLFLPLKEIYCLRLNNIFLLVAVLIFYASKLAQPFYKRAILLLIIYILGSNLHGGTILLFIIPFLLEINQKTKEPLYLRLFLLLLISSTSVLINPYSHDFIKLIFDYSLDGSYKKYILDWRTILTLPLMPLSLLHLSIFSFFFTINSYWKKIPWNELLLIVILLILGLLFRRFYILFALISAPYFASSIQDIFVSLKWKPNLITKFNLVTFLTIFVLFFNNFFIHYNQENNYPQKAIAYIELNVPKDSVIYNQDIWGGYLLWKMPDRKIFIDGRAPQAKFEDKTIVEEAIKFYSEDPSTISQQLEKFSFDYLLIKKNQSYFTKIDCLAYKLTKNDVNNLSKPIAANLITFLGNHKEDWQLVYSDDIALIYKKIPK